MENNHAQENADTLIPATAIASAASALTAYVHDMIYSPAGASLDYNLLPEPLTALGKELEHLFKLISETRNLAHELANGKLDCAIPPPGNKIAAPLKELHSSLKHLTWQAQQISKGDYSQQVDFMGDFSLAFNNMIKQLDRHFHEIEQARSEADHASRAKTDFLAKMSHEIRTPMNVILGMSEIALRESKPEAKNEHIYMVKQAASNLLAIINDILDFSKIEAGKMKIVRKEYSVASLLNDIVSIIRMRVIDSQIRFAVKTDRNIPHTLIGDETKIRQVVLNILNNAVKYTEKGFVSLGVYVDFISDDTVSLNFEIKDSGIGIKPEDMDKLFNNFSQLDPDRNQHIEGVGLGLAITKSIVDAMGGNITVKSEYGRGSTFTIKLIQNYHSRDAMAEIQKTKDISVIIYERRQVYSESLYYAITNLGASCTTVSSGTELYEKMENRRFDYLIISSALFSRNEDTISKFGQNTKTVILCVFGEDIPEKYLNVLAMPVYCTHIANLINGVYENFSFTGNESIAKFSAPNAKILVVDDINTNLKVAEGLLAPYNMKVDLCNSGKAAIEAMRLKRHDLVFMDHKMPFMDGVETARRIREMGENDPYYKEVPIIALTANAVSGMKEFFIESGFNDFISKPIDTVQLNAIIEKWIPKEMQEGRKL